MAGKSKPLCPKNPDADPTKLTKREERQLRSALALLDKIRGERTRDCDDDTEPTYHAALALYHLQDYLNTIEDCRDRARTNALARALTGEDAIDAY